MALNWDFSFIDCQVTNPHLISLGAEEILRDDFLDQLAESMEKLTRQGKWDLEVKVESY